LAGGGPDGMTCGQCRYLVPHNKKLRCLMARRDGQWGEPVPRNARSCRHFVEA
jgi:hypothetical protein